jgi:hypothetical protein
MAVLYHVLPQAVARRFADAVRSEPAAKRLWVWSQPGYIDPEREYVELWLLHDPVDEATEQRMRVAAAALHEHFPEVHIRVHRVTPQMLGGHPPAEAIREGAEEVTLRPE